MNLTITTDSPFPLLELPEDLLEEVFSASPLTAEDLCSLQLVCRRVNAVVQDNAVWRALCYREGLLNPGKLAPGACRLYFQQNWEYCLLAHGNFFNLKPQLNLRYEGLILGAVKAGHEKLVCRVLELKIVKKYHQEPDLLLVQAAAAGQESVVEKLPNACPSVWGRNRTAIVRAASNGHIEILKRLLDRNPGPSFLPTIFGYALLCAAGRGFKEVVQLLLNDERYGDRIPESAKDEAIVMAAVMGHYDVLELFGNKEDLLNRYKGRIEQFKELYFQNIRRFSESTPLLPDCVHLLLDQKQYFVNISIEDLKGLLEPVLQRNKRTKDEILELYLTDEELLPKILSDIGLTALILEHLSFGFEAGDQKDFHNSNKLILHILRHVDPSTFYKHLGHVLYFAIKNGNIALVKYIIRNHKIPDYLAPYFIKATEEKDITEPYVHCLIEKPKMAWFIDAVNFQRTLGNVQQ